MTIKKSIQDLKEGRTYVYSCGLKHGKCFKSGLKPTICFSCHSDECKRWYRLGRKDERKK